MKGLDSLIRLHKWRLDEKKREITALQNFAGRLKKERERLVLDFEQEKAVATASPEAGMTFEAYARHVRKRLAKLDGSVVQVVEKLEMAREDLAEAFQEVKRYEITRDSRERRAQERQRRLETEEMDEIGGHRFRRRI